MPRKPELGEPRAKRKLASTLFLVGFLFMSCGSRPDPNLAKGSELVVGREGPTTVILRWSSAPAGRRYRVYAGPNPRAIDRTLALGELSTGSTPGGALRLRDIPKRPRPYFVLVDAESGSEHRVAERRLPVEGSHNFRDYGGYPTSDGRRVRWGKLYRSDHLADLSDAGVAYLADLQLSWIGDFRSSAERTDDPSRFPSRESSANRQPSVVLLTIADDSYDPQELPNRRPGVAPLTSANDSYDSRELQKRILSGRIDDLDLANLLEKGNRKFITQHGAAFAALIHRLSGPGGLPSLIHCTAGKDRTGFGAALVLRLLGVPDEIIYADFMLTNLYSAEHIKRTQWSIRLASLFRTDPEKLEPILGVERRYLKAAFDEIDRRYGDFDRYLKEGLGVSQREIRSLRDKLLE